MGPKQQSFLVSCEADRSWSPRSWANITCGILHLLDKYTPWSLSHARTRRSVSHLCQCQESFFSGHTKGCNSVSQPIWVYGYIKLLIILNHFLFLLTWWTNRHPLWAKDLLERELWGQIFPILRPWLDFFSCKSDIGIISNNVTVSMEEGEMSWAYLRVHTPLWLYLLGKYINIKPGWMSYKLEPRLPGEISTTSDRQMIPH